VSTATHRLVCPFPPCSGWWNVSANVWQVPYHNVIGPNVPPLFRHFKCPGALVNFHLGTDRILSADRQGLIDRGEIYWARLAEWRASERRATEAAQAANTEPETPMMLPEGRPPDLTEGKIIYFPGRPADAPEPGAGEAATQPVDYGNVAGHHLGRAEVDNAHDTTRGLVVLAMAKMRETQGKLAACGNALDGAVGIATMAEMEVTAGNALVVAAVGSGADKPSPAEAMAEQMAVAVDTIMGPDGGNVFNAIEVARIRVETASQQVAAALTQAEQYLALLS
jgi:hypothetical protein